MMTPDISLWPSRLAGFFTPKQEVLLSHQSRCYFPCLVAYGKQSQRCTMGKHTCGHVTHKLPSNLCATWDASYQPPLWVDASAPCIFDTAAHQVADYCLIIDPRGLTWISLEPLGAPGALFRELVRVTFCLYDQILGCGLVSMWRLQVNLLFRRCSTAIIYLAFTFLHLAPSQISCLEPHKSPGNSDILDFTPHNQDPNAALKKY